MTQGEQHLQFWTERLRAPSYVYVIQGVPDTPIKIGYATDVLDRLASLQTGNWDTLRLLHTIPGPRDLEWQFHYRLRSARVRGEWFDPAKMGEFLEYVSKLSDAMVAAYAEDGEAPAFRKFDGEWYMRRPGQPPVRLRFVEPSPVDPEVAAQRRAAHWTRKRRGELGPEAEAA